MAALIRHGLLGNLSKSTSSILAVNTTSLRCNVTRSKSKKVVKKTKFRLEDNNKSLAAKGFLRYQKGYDPPANASDLINNICNDQAISTNDSTKLEDPLQRFNLFLACEKELQHSIPNSVLYSIETIADLKEFYQTPIGVNTPLDGMRTMELPKNLHITYDYHRFHPSTDTMFDGKTAFPKSSTIVTGLKYKKKYPGCVQENPYLDQLLKI
ncbi:39S ribosomal protein L50, mitochondrial [Colletes gigas]|uniref:39S ribosomal protein L50, mitochondrial n=1 Tax=Colletes gigas TaxID=935657 RepID=UPI001C9BACB2|nr:39S ribosomal protein L50, mitochondrial [Colletes gigas]